MSCFLMTKRILNATIFYVCICCQNHAKMENADFVRLHNNATVDSDEYRKLLVGRRKI